MKTNYLKSKIKNEYLYNLLITVVVILAIGIIIYFINALIQVLSEIIFI